jgi:hypothetical protein
MSFVRRAKQRIRSILAMAIKQIPTELSDTNNLTSTKSFKSNLPYGHELRPHASNGKRHKEESKEAVPQVNRGRSLSKGDRENTL